MILCPRPPRMADRADPSIQPQALAALTPTHAPTAPCPRISVPVRTRTRAPSICASGHRLPPANPPWVPDADRVHSRLGVTNLMSHAI